MRRRRQQPQRLPRAQPGHVRRRHHAAHTQAAQRQLLPRGRRRALPASRPRRGLGGGRDARHGHVDAQGAARRREARHFQIIEGPGQRDSAQPGRRRRRAARAGSGRIAHAVPVARCHVREVQARRARLLDGRGRGDRLRRGRLAACAGPARRGHRVIRLVARLPARDQGARPRAPSPPAGRPAPRGATTSTARRPGAPRPRTPPGSRPSSR